MPNLKEIKSKVNSKKLLGVEESKKYLRVGRLHRYVMGHLFNLKILLQYQQFTISHLLGVQARLE